MHKYFGTDQRTYSFGLIRLLLKIVRSSKPEKPRTVCNEMLFHD